ncbi:hypothetical protein [Cellulomonas alba]|uniref:Gram-positive cocci surface proteins LPxTG domain-containing protein n=1 Tax=Cellulomonas alba TaxID=3053467 RepID=A0ABT7SH59_9CELL|nr:hypothetical protein [Cellulomonas alba]MDM7855510.1 hypothetical protein [Cellulomonas alba]
MHHLVRRSSATLGALALVAIGALAGAQSASAVAGDPTDTTLTVAGTVATGHNLAGTVSVTGFVAALPDAVVDLSVDGGTATEVPLTVDMPSTGTGTGSASISVPTTGLALGDHTLTASFAAQGTLAASQDVATFTVLPASVAWQLRYADGSKVGATLTQFVVHAVGSDQIPGAAVSLMAGMDGLLDGEEIGHGTVKADGSFDVSANVFDADVVLPGTSTDYWVVVTPSGQPAIAGAKVSVAAPLLSFKIALETPANPKRGIARVSFTTSIATVWLDEVLADPADTIDAAGLKEGFKEGGVFLLVDGKPVDPATIKLADGAAGIVKGSFPAPAVGKHTAQLVVPGFEGILEDSASPVRSFTIRARVLTPVVHHHGDVHPGDSITVTGTGVQPHATVKIVLHSTPVTLGTVKADASGAFSATVVIPGSTPAGAHTIVVTATAAGTAKVTGSTPLTVVAVDPSSELATTGSNDAGLGGIAGALVLAGAGAVVLARRATRSHS